MSLQACVEGLFALNSNYLHVEQAFNQASSLQTLSDDLYTDPFRFVYELIQNADDASSTQIRIALIEGDYLIISHNGEIFDEKDVQSLCAVNHSTKTRNSQTVGYKGLGFKAIFGKSDYVLIVTNREAFRFDRNFEFSWKWPSNRAAWEHTNGRQFMYPWQICPIWTKSEEIPRLARSWITKTKMPVNIIICLNNVDETRNALNELASQPHTFLFLRHIRQIEFAGLLPSSIIHIEEKPDGSVKLSYGNNQHTQGLVSRRQIRIPAEILTDIRLPQKLRSAQYTDIGLAARIKERTFIPVLPSDSVLFAYMPTKISAYELPLLINANFLTNANREQIHTDSIWNQWLFESVPRETVAWVTELIKRPNWSNTAYDLLPIPIRGNDLLANKYNNSCSAALKNTKFIRNAQEEYLTPSEAIIDLTGLSNPLYIGNEPIRQYIIDHYNDPTSLSTRPFIPDNPRLKELGVRVFDWKNAIEMLKSRAFQENFSIDHALRLIVFFFNQTTNEEISQWLHLIPFIMDRNRHLRTPPNIYFPSQFDDVAWHSPDCQEAYIHPDLMKELPSSHRHWLETLGVTTKTDLTFFLRTIVSNASTFITPDIALSTIQKLFVLHINRAITTEQLKSVGELALFTVANNLVPANRLYLSSPYQPCLPLDAVLSTRSDLFVSPIYLQGDFPLDWKRFFLQLGVQENIVFVRLSDDCRFFQNYHDDQIRIIFGLNAQHVHGYRYRITLNLLELTEDNYQFARLFWSYVVATINVRQLNQSEIAYWGLPGRRGAVAGSEVNTYPQWFIHTRPCIPVLLSTGKNQYKKQCLKAAEVFSEYLRPLIGHYLPIFDCLSNVELLADEWQRFFRLQNELSIDNHLFLLKQIYIQNQIGIDGEDKIRIQYIYGDLLRKLSEIDQNQRESYRERCRLMNLCLLSSLDDLFMPVEELRFWSIDTFVPPPQLHMLKLSRENRQHPHLTHLLYVLNIGIIQMNNLHCIPTNAAPCDELTNRLQKSYFLSLLEFHKIKDKEKLNQLDYMKFFEADRLELNITGMNMSVGDAPVYLNDNCLYAIRPWNSPSVSLQLASKICELLYLPNQVFQKHICDLLTTSSVDHYFIELAIVPAHTSTFNGQFKNLIEQDNHELFDQMQQLPSLSTPAELLIAGLAAQNSRWIGYIYHYTHLENAASILHDQMIKSRQLCQANNFKDSSAYDFMSQTDDRVNNYVRFYFRPRTLTQFHNENLGSRKGKKRNDSTPMCPVPIFFRINLEEVLKIQDLKWKVSLSDMSTAHTEYDCTLDVIRRLDFSGLFKDINTERGKYSAQLEFLIENKLDFRCLPKDAITLVYQNRDAQTSLECLFTEQLMISSIDRDYFFGINDRIFINHDEEQDHISVMIDPRQARRMGGMFIVQIKCDRTKETIDVACKGSICATFCHDHITTVYGKEELLHVAVGKEARLDVAVGKQAYAVYYRYEKRVWLIYTNHLHCELDNSHREQHPECVPYD